MKNDIKIEIDREHRLYDYQDMNESLASSAASYKSYFAQHRAQIGRLARHN